MATGEDGAEALSHADGEDRLRERVARARDLGIEAEELIGTDWVAAPDFPDSIVHRLRVVTVTEYQSVISLLGDPLLAPAAEVLIRAMLEGLAHAWWIDTGDPQKPGGWSARPRSCTGNDDLTGCTRASRAMCLELGMACALVQDIRRSDPTSLGASTLPEASLWFNEIWATHAASGCLGVGRDFRSVRMGLIAFGDALGMTWPHDLWMTSSAYAHQLLPQRQAVATGSGLAWGGPLPLTEREKLLEWSVKTFLNFYQLVLHVVAPQQLDGLRAVAVSHRFA